MRGFIEIVELFLSDTRVYPASFFDDAILGAARNGHSKIIERLLQDSRVEPDADHVILFYIYAARNGHLKVVELLLADHRMNSWANHKAIMEHAIYSRNFDIVDLLVQHRYKIDNDKYLELSKKLK